MASFMYIFQGHVPIFRPVLLPFVRGFSVLSSPSQLQPNNPKRCIRFFHKALHFLFISSKPLDPSITTLVLSRKHPPTRLFVPIRSLFTVSVLRRKSKCSNVYFVHTMWSRDFQRDYTITVKLCDFQRARSQKSLPYFFSIVRLTEAL